MNNCLKFLLAGTLAFAALFSGAAYSGNTTGIISVLETHPGANLAYISVNGTNNSPPGCNTSNRYVLDISTNSGRLVYASILAAKTAGQSVTIYGSGACTLAAGTGSEDFSIIRQ